MEGRGRGSWSLLRVCSAGAVVQGEQMAATLAV